MYVLYYSSKCIWTMSVLPGEAQSRRYTASLAIDLHASSGFVLSSPLMGRPLQLEHTVTTPAKRRTSSGRASLFRTNARRKPTAAHAPRGKRQDDRHLTDVPCPSYLLRSTDAGVSLPPILTCRLPHWGAMRKRSEESPSFLQSPGPPINIRTAEAPLHYCLRRHPQDLHWAARAWLKHPILAAGLSSAASRCAQRPPALDSPSTRSSGSSAGPAQANGST
ncbi:hypothetical protein CC78DRAFT_613382 [Lojkania enalia]|uniref:Uncharacterized protein n=1 Tax=Lojkania enalia TaxID=147567 RepID=A0A9P4KI06_9PLEO|nr:hypothetical protein CC78DRAFT_613382 [Didymosphaeria enalia]